MEGDTVDERIEFWQREEQAPFAGWDFSYLDGRMMEEDVPWSYETRAQKLMRQVTAFLDMDTGENLCRKRERASRQDQPSVVINSFADVGQRMAIQLALHQRSSCDSGCRTAGPRVHAGAVTSTSCVAWRSNR